MKRIAVVILVLTAASPARADGYEGAACETTSECGELHCVERVCVDVANGPPHRVAPLSMLGDGRGYVPAILIADLTALTTAGALLGAAFASASGTIAVAGAIPPVLAGPLIHAIHGRGVYAVISFFAWAAVPPTTLVAALFGGAQSSYDTGVEVLSGALVGITFATGLTALDAYFARAAPRTTSDARWVWMPSITPTRDGVSASIVGMW